MPGEAVMNDSIQILCAATGRSAETVALADGSPKLPRGWRRLGSGRTLSPQGWAQTYRPRAVRVPVASVTVEGSEDTTAGWKAFREAYHAASRDATAYANAALLRFALLDSQLPLEKTDKETRLPKVPSESRNAWLREVYALGEQFPAIDTQSRVQIRNDALSDYSALRWKLRVTHQAVSTGYKSGYPIPFPASTVKLARDDGNGWISLRLRLGGTPYWLRLSGSHRYARALEALRRLGDDAEMGAVSLSERIVFGEGANRDRQTQGRKQLVATVVVYLPIQAKGVEPDRVLSVTVGRSPLLTARVADSEHEWRLHADDLFRGLAHWREVNGRLGDDRKFERRHGRAREQFGAHVGQVAERRRRWVDDRLHKVARELVNFAARTRCGVIRWDDSGAVELGPRFKLRSLVEQKAAEFGVAVAVACDCGMAAV